MKIRESAETDANVSSGMKIRKSAETDANVSSGMKIRNSAETDANVSFGMKTRSSAGTGFQILHVTKIWKPVPAASIAVLFLYRSMVASRSGPREIMLIGTPR